MRTKKIAALGLAVLMTVGTCVPVMAADVAGSDSTNATGNTTVTYTQPVSYTAVIPASVTVDKTNGVELTVSVKDTILETGKVINVTTDVTGNKLTLGTGEDTQEVDFALDASSNAALSGTNTSCKYTVGAPAANFKTAGDHTATVAFTFTYGETPAAP